MIIKLIKLFFLLLAFPFFLHAQTTVSYSPSFEEPEPGRYELLSLKNGNTAFLNISNKGIEVRIFDVNHNKKAHKFNKEEVKDIGLYPNSIRKIAELNNVIVLFAETWVKKDFNLYVIVVNPASGSIDKVEKILDTRDKGTWNMPQVYIDPISGSYVIVYNIEEEPLQYHVRFYDQRLSLVGEQVINTSNVQHPHYLGGLYYNHTLSSLFIDFDEKSKSSTAPMFLATTTIDNTETRDIGVKTLTDIYKHMYSLRYSPQKSYIDFINSGKVGSDSKYKMLKATTQTQVFYATHLLRIGPVDNNIILSQQLQGVALDEYAKENFPDKKTFSGIYDRLEAKHDGSTVAIFQEQYTVQKSKSTSTLSGDLGLLYLNEKGEEDKGVVIRKAHVTGNSFMRNDFQIQQYFSYVFFSTPKADYVVFNDLPENFNKPLTAEPHTVPTISDANAILFKIEGDSISKSYLFGEPYDKRSSNFIMAGSAVFDSNSNMLITLMVNNERGKKNAKVAWVKFE